MTITIATPTQARADRIRRLTALIRKASTELEHLLAIERRTQKAVPTDVPAEATPSDARATIINAWAVKAGAIDRITPGRVPVWLRVAYMAAGEPDGQ